nr:unnamed protein product [Callosobruchus analis]
MKDIIYKDYPVEDKDLTSKKYVDSAVASNNQNIVKRFDSVDVSLEENKRVVDILTEKLSAKATSLEVLDLKGRLGYVGMQLAQLQKKIEHK